MNLRPLHPQCSALPDCATLRLISLESLRTILFRVLNINGLMRFKFEMVDLDQVPDVFEVFEDATHLVQFVVSRI